MRITQNALYDQLRLQLSKSTSQLMSAQEVVATQKRINRLSDDAIDGGRLLDLNTSISRSEQFLDNISRAVSLNDIYDSTLGQIADLIAEAKDLLLGETDDMQSTEATRDAARIQIANLSNQLAQVANTRFDGRYIFSGYQTDTEAYNEASFALGPVGGYPGAVVATDQLVVDYTQLTYHDYEIQFTGAATYDVVDLNTGANIVSGAAYVSGEAIRFDGLSVTLTDDPPAAIAGTEVFTVTSQPPGTIYGGDNGVQRVEIQPGTYIDQNIPGDRIFEGAGVAGGVDIFDALNRAYTALQDNDRAEIENLLAEIDQGYEQVLNERTAIGARYNLLTQIEERQEDIKLGMEILKSDLEDVDVADAITELNKRQNVYEATLGASANIVQPSLLDFLG